MKYLTDNKNREPAYIQLYKQVRDDIVNGIYPYGSKLPSKRTISLDAGVSTITVEHAYSLLCEEGYIKPKERSGYFVIFNKEAGFVSASMKKVNFISHKSQANTTDDLPFSILAKTMRSVISEFGEGILQRSPNFGCIELREAIGMYLAKNRGIHADSSQIIIGSGSEHLYTLLIELFGKKLTYAIESPSYKKIEQVYTAAEINLEKLALGNDGIESKALFESKADILHISPYRSFPSGVTASASKRHEYLSWAGSNGKYIIEDDFESEFSVSRKPFETLFSQSNKNNIIYMNTFSMTVSPSFRIGYMVLPAHLAEKYQSKLGFYSCTVPTYMQLVLTELIKNGNFARHINKVRRLKRKEINQQE